MQQGSPLTGGPWFVCAARALPTQALRNLSVRWRTFLNGKLRLTDTTVQARTDVLIRKVDSFEVEIQPSAFVHIARLPIDGSGCWGT
jgi:hypothetical protein